jgi:hypothetical protein
VSTTITDDEDPTILTLSVARDSLVNWSNTEVEFFAEVDHAPQTDLILNLSNGVQITIEKGELTGSSGLITIHQNDGTIEVKVDSAVGGNYEFLDYSDTATITVTDSEPTADEVNLILDDEAATNTYRNPNLGGLDDIHPDPANPATGGVLPYNFGADGVGAILLTGVTLPTTGDFSSSLSDDGLTLTIKQSQNAAIVEVAKVTLLDSATGHYTVEQLNPVFHPTPGASEENVDFQVKYTVTEGGDDTDRDSIDGFLNISINDDTPELHEVESLTIEKPIEVGRIDGLSFGADGPLSGGGLALTNWTNLDGITETLSPDGKTLTATFGDSHDVFYRMTLNDDGSAYTLNP